MLVITLNKYNHSYIYRLDVLILSVETPAIVKSIISGKYSLTTDTSVVFAVLCLCYQLSAFLLVINHEIN